MADKEHFESLRQMASLAASNWHKPLSLIPCLSWTTASSVFTKGVLSGAIPWKQLQKEFKANSVYATELWKLIHSPEMSGRTKTEAFLLGKHFHDYFTEPHGTQFYPMNNLSDDINSESCGPRKTGANASVEANPVPVGSSNPSHNYSTLAGIGKSMSPQQHLLQRNKSYDASSNSNKTSVWNIHHRLLDAFNSGKKELPAEALDFMRGVMDECTHLGNFSVPVDPELIIIVSALNDAYVPQEHVMSLQKLWPGCEVRNINTGHILAVLAEQSTFRTAIKDSFDRQIKKYYTKDTVEAQS